MRGITKKPEPSSLTEHRSNSHTDFSNLKDEAKQELRESLVSEQQGLCCYCMARIRPEVGSTKIEHWLCQSRNTALDLSYSNLLAACMGGEGQPKKRQHCDTCKEDLDIKWNPADPTHVIETRLTYEPDGTISAEDAEFDSQINDVLNLNYVRIRDNRRASLDSFLEWRKRERPNEGGLRAKLSELTTDNGALPEYSAIVVWWLRKKLKLGATI